MSKIERLLVRMGANFIPYKFAMKIGRGLLATQGIGWGGSIKTSGEISFIYRVLSNVDSPLVIDCGGNIGEYSYYCLCANKTAELHIFEPSLPHLEKIKENLQQFLGRIIINHKGLSNIEQNCDLFKNEEITGLASLIPRDLSHIGYKLDLVETVSLMVGDKYLEKLKDKSIHLLKIDVEGWEMSVLKGFFKSLNQKKIKCIQFEFGHAHIERRENFRDFFRFFFELGYFVGIMKPNGRIIFIDSYNEIYENYYAANYVATYDEKLKKILI